MKIIHNSFIPFKGFGAINILGFVFSRIPEKNISARTKRHEGTHTYQQYELICASAIISLIICNIWSSWIYLALIPTIPFALYIMSFLIEMVIPPYHNAKELFVGKDLFEKVKSIRTWVVKVWMDAYTDNCFEREAYMNDGDPLYNSVRSWFSWWKYIIPSRERKE